jgi:heat shock protein HtpX
MKNQIKTIVLLGLLSVVLIGIGGALGKGFLLVSLVLSLAMNLGAYFFSDRLVLAMHGAQEVSPAEAPGLHRMVEELSRRAGIPKPRVFMMHEAQPNAFATGRNPNHAAVAVTQGILNVLTWDELKGVLAHEISHVKNRDILIGSVAAAVAMGITFVARIAMWGSMFGDDREGGGNIFVILAVSILAPLAAGLLQMALSRSREFEADRSGARLLHDGEPLARALEKIEASVRAIPMNVDPVQAQKYIVNPLTGRKVQFANLFTTHPPTAERVARLRQREWAQ